MGKKTQASDSGMWFYHAPAKTQSQEPVGVPPASQIPLLNPDLAPSDDDRPKMWIRDSDSDYTKLAKMGGRQDLLSMRVNSGAPKPGPKAYPTVDWFYLQDNEREREEERVKETDDYKFMLPDYMVHPDSGKVRASRYPQEAGSTVPYASDKKTVYERDEHRATDKTVRIPEVRPAGFGYRQERHKPKSGPGSQAGAQPERRTEIPSNPGSSQSHRKGASQKDDEPINMNKIMSYSYGKDWLSDRDQKYDRHRKMSDKFEEASSTHEQQRVSQKGGGDQQRNHRRGKKI